ncbi:MAG: nitrilase family protein [Dyadobacter sp. 50-39]|uniref:amidohydrolase n=1 Tax=Dyadobacter sp. 50-39 TaxID=1895756 RepID=UPI00096017F2|nr:amidohydrolase [Dyadobacter sp. 50-39]OJV21374.1 MAG: nitrilase family protein [Dyadobacter sp. 50-39]
MQENKEILSIALVQADLHWENVTANLASFEEKLAALPEPVDVIVLPEMFNTGFTMSTALAEPMNFTTTRWMKQIAKQHNALVVGSFAVNEVGSFFNRLLCVRPDGSYVHSDKRHLFTMGEERKHYTAGKVRLTVEWRGWKLCPLVCYDLRFPVWSRNLHRDPYDILLYVANWPTRRAHAWSALLQARAIENQCYVVGVNRIGTDMNGLEYRGDSVALDYLGEPMAMLASQETEKIVHMSKTDLSVYRRSFPALPDADDFEIHC